MTSHPNQAATAADKLVTTDQAPTDAELVDRSRRGDRASFGLIVGRYQSLVCAIAYSSCGNVARSEDVAQEVFLSAWKQIAQLREPERLKEWLCGIARLTALQAYRRDRREPAQFADELPTTAVAPEPLPFESATQREEEQILWRALERLPATYREVLVLYYREHRSIEHVAVALDLSEENVRQRLSRGRKELHDEVTRMLEVSLTATIPGAAFTSAVVGALPPLMGLGTVAAGSSGAKGGMAVKAAFTSLSFLAAWVSGVLLAALGIFIQLGDAQNSAERGRVILRWAVLGLGGLAFLAGILWVSLGSAESWEAHSGIRLFILVASSLAYLTAVGIFLFSCVAGKMSRWGTPQFEFRSHTSLLGLPLVHVCYGLRENGRVKPAKGWIAFGKLAYGAVFACGGVAIAPVACGAFSFGLIALGGFATGGYAFGLLALGFYATGGMAAGYFAYGGCVAGWRAALGNVVWAHDYAGGGWPTSALGRANDTTAWDFLNGQYFFKHSQALLTAGVIASWVPFLILFEMRRRKSPPNRASSISEI